MPWFNLDATLLQKIWQSYNKGNFVWSRGQIPGYNLGLAVYLGMWLHPSLFSKVFTHVLNADSQH